MPEGSVIPAPCTLGTREDSVISAPRALGTREDSVVSASPARALGTETGTREPMTESRRLVLGTYSDDYTAVYGCTDSAALLYLYAVRTYPVPVPKTFLSTAVRGTVQPSISVLIPRFLGQFK